MTRGLTTPRFPRSLAMRFMPSTPSLPSLYSLPSLPSLPPPDGPPAGAAPAVRQGALGANAQAVLDALWDPVDGQVDLRDFSPDALGDLASFMLRDCEETRFVAVPSHCPVTALHALLVGLPSLEALFTWDPGESQPIRLALGRHLKLIMGDLATLSRTIGPDDVQRVACNDPRLPITSLVQQTLSAMPRLRIPHPATSGPTEAPAGETRQGMRERPLTLFCDGERLAIRNDAVGYRLATWQQTEPASSRPSSPEASVEAPVLRSGRAGRAGRLRSACESLLARLPAPVLRRSKSV